MMFSAAAIAVVSEVNPDEPGASFFHHLHLFLFSLLLLAGAFGMTSAQAAAPLQTAMATAIYHNTQIELTPMLFHRIELGMTYEVVANTIGKSALYCDSGESSCNASNGSVAKNCLESEFIHPNKTWLCHWEGKSTQRNANSRLEVWFVGLRTIQVVAIMPDGNIYRRDSSNAIGLERHTLN
jgi:hypothetical protein